MQPFNYQNYYQPQYQQPQFQPQYNQIPTVNGRIVNDFNEVRISDIPTDGSPAFFMKRDMSEAQSRVWSTDGSIKTVTFKPEIQPIEIKEDINDRVNDLTERIDKIEKSIKSQTRKKVEENE